MEKSSKYTLLKTVSQFLRLVYKSFNAWFVMLVYGTVTTICSYAFYFASLCNSDNLACFMTINIVVALALMTIIIFYAVDFYRTAFKNSVFKFSSLLNLGKDKIKSVGFITLYILSFVVSAYVSWKILQKPANPNWKIEFIYFTVFFVFCIVPIAAMRFSAIIAFYLDTLKVPSFKYLYKQTEGHSYIGIIGFLMIVLVLSVLNLQMHVYVVYLATIFSSSIVINILGTFLGALALLFTINVLMCFSEAQRQLMSAEQDKREENSVQKLPPVKSVQKNTSKKSKGKKKKD